MPDRDLLEPCVPTEVKSPCDDDDDDDDDEDGAAAAAADGDGDGDGDDEALALAKIKPDSKYDGMLNIIGKTRFFFPKASCHYSR